MRWKQTSEKSYPYQLALNGLGKGGHAGRRVPNEYFRRRVLYVEVKLALIEGIYRPLALRRMKWMRDIVELLKARPHPGISAISVNFVFLFWKISSMRIPMYI